MQFPWNKKETDLQREVQYHLESLADGFEKEGMSREEAMRRARREFGAVEQLKEECRDESRWRVFSELAQDLRYGMRMLRKAPAVTMAAVASLALGIGATTAILSLMDAVLFRTLGVPDAQQLTQMLWQAPQRVDGPYRSSSGSMYREDAVVVADFFSQSAFQALQRAGKGRVEIAARIHHDAVSTSYEGTTAVAKLRPVSGNFFEMLRVQPQLGRVLQPSDDRAESPFCVLLSHHFWQKNLGANPAVVGRALRMNNRSYTIAGVLPAAFTGIEPGDATDLYTAIAHAPILQEADSFERKAASDPMAWYLQLLARRATNTTNEALAQQLQPVFESTWAKRPKNVVTAPKLRLEEASGGIGSLRREIGNPLVILFALVGFVLLIACGNIANLLLARADVRRKEVALRLSLGCSRGRLIRQFFTESALLAAIGGALSLAVTYVTANSAITLMPNDVRLDFEIDLRMILGTLAVTAVTTLVFGLYPAWRAAQVDAAPALKEGSGSVGGIRHRWISPGKLLVLGQVALGVVLVAAGGAFTAHLRKILNADTGFERSRLLMFDLRPGESGYKGPRLKQFYARLEESLQAIPGVQHAGIARIRPMLGGGYWDDMNFPGRKEPVPTAVNFVSAGYLDALGVRIVAGRAITQADVNTNAKVAVVSEDVQNVLGRSPVGMSFKMEDQMFQVIGVASRARYARLTQQPNVVYVPNTLQRDSATFVVRTAVPPTRVLPAVRKAVADLDSQLPIVQPVTMDDQIATTLRRERLFAWLCGAFGVLALLLCMVGLYGVMSYAIARRGPEIGIRMALGAAPLTVLRHVVVEGLGVALAGCLLGVPVAWWAALRYVDYKKLGMDPFDPKMLVWVIAALSLSAILAVLGPALRASWVDPMKALREG